MSIAAAAEHDSDGRSRTRETDLARRPVGLLGGARGLVDRLADAELDEDAP
jgi:hypothetical protein